MQKKSRLPRVSVRALFLLPIAAALSLSLPLPATAAPNKAADAEETSADTPSKTAKKPKAEKAARKPKADAGADSKTAEETEKEKKTPKSPKKPASAVKSIPFHGVVTAVDPEAKTLTLGTKVFHLTDATLVVDGPKSALLKDVKIGRKVGGSYHTVKTRNEVIKLNLGVKQESTPAKPKKPE